MMYQSQKFVHLDTAPNTISSLLIIQFCFHFSAKQCQLEKNVFAFKNTISKMHQFQVNIILTYYLHIDFDASHLVPLALPVGSAFLVHQNAIPPRVHYVQRVTEGLACN